MAKPKPTTETLRRLISYDPATGSCTWNPRTAEDFPNSKYPQRDATRFNNHNAGKECFTCPQKNKYGRGLQAVVCGWHSNAARVVWEIYYGQEPDEVIALNGDLKDLRIDNLQNQSRSRIAKNETMFSHNTSGIRGVYWDKSRNLWKAQIYVNGKSKELGRFTTKERAAKARQAAEKKHGFKAYTNAS